MTKTKWLGSISVLTALPSLVWASVLCASLFISVIFFKLPQQTVTSSVGSYLLSSFPTGLALYSGNDAKHYYSISPLNDYIITNDGFRVALLTGSSFDENNFNKDNSHSKLHRIYETVGNYFDFLSPSYVLNRSEKVVYTTRQLDSNTVTIYKDEVLPKTYEAVTTALTLSYDPQDFVYSPDTGSLFTDHTDSEIAWLKEITDVDITQSIVPEEYTNTRLFTWKIDARKIVIINQDHSGYIIVTANANQSLLVNPKNNLIEVVESIPANSTEHVSSITIQVAAETPN